jgi:hypothetical protein
VPQVGLALIGGATTLGIGATLAIQIGASVAFSAIAKKKAKSTDSGGFGAELDLSGDPNDPRYIIYGRAWTAGTLRYRNTTGVDQRELYAVIVLAGHECQQVDLVEADRENLTLDGSGEVTSPAKWVGKMNIRFLLGTDSQAADSTFDSAFSNWTSNHRLRGCTIALIKLTYDEEHLNQFPAFRFRVKGRKVYDPRLDSTNGGAGAHRLATPSTWEWSENPVLCHNDYWRGVMINSIRIAGPGVGTGRFTWSNVAAEANVCEENVSLAAGGTEDRYTANGIIDPRSTHGEVLEMFEQSMAGDIAFSDGKWRYFAGAYRAPSLSLTADHFVGPLRMVVHKGESDRRDTAHGRFSSLAESGTTISYSPVSLATATAGSERVTNIDLALVNDLNNAAGYDGGARAQRIAKLLLERDAAGKLITCTTNLYGLRAVPGESISVTHAAFGLSAQVMRVMDVSLRPVQDGDKAGIVVDLLLGAGPSSLYTWSAEEAAIGAAPTLLQVNLTQFSPVGWAADSDGKPAGVRGIEGITDRSQLELVSGVARIQATPDTTVGYGLPAVPILDSLDYLVLVKWQSTAASADGLYLRMNELAGALSSGTTHVGNPGGGAEACVETRDSFVAIVPDDSAMPGTGFRWQTFEYSPTSGTEFASLSFYNWNPSTACALDVQYVGLTVAGNSINLLEGPRTQAHTSDLLPEAATEVYAITDAGPVDETVGAFGVESGAPFDSIQTSVEHEDGDVIDIVASFNAELVGGTGTAAIFLGPNATLQEAWLDKTGVTREAVTLSGQDPLTAGTTNFGLYYKLTDTGGAGLTLRLTNISVVVTLIKR